MRASHALKAFTKTSNQEELRQKREQVRIEGMRSLTSRTFDINKRYDYAPIY